jgi:hypothetical protein
MGKLKDYVWEFAIAAGVGAALVFAYFWWASSVASAELVRQKVETEQTVVRLEEANEKLGKDTAAKAAQNEQLMGLIQDMRLELRELKDQVSDLRQVTAERLVRVASMPMETIAVETAQELNLPPAAIIVLPDSTLSFTPEASRVNLEHLIQGTSDKAELVLSRKEIENLEGQLERGKALVANKDDIISNKDGEIANVREEMDSRLKLKDAEIGALKAKLRKRTVVSSVFGFIAGLMAKALFL